MKEKKKGTPGPTESGSRTTDINSLNSLSSPSLFQPVFFSPSPSSFSHSHLSLLYLFASFASCSCNTICIGGSIQVFPYLNPSGPCLFKIDRRGSTLDPRFAHSRSARYLIPSLLFPSLDLIDKSETSDYSNVENNQQNSWSIQSWLVYGEGRVTWGRTFGETPPLPPCPP